MIAPHMSPSYRAGELLFLSGQLAFGADGRVSGDISAQTRVVLERLEAELGRNGLDRAHIVKANAWITDSALFAAYNEAYAAFFGAHRPARSTIVSALAVEGALVEIDAVARFEIG
jgi:2-iminobutanoate/2-iminopropanoate deaminase